MGGISNPAAGAGRVDNRQRSGEGTPHGLDGRSVGQEQQAQGILIAALGTLAAAFTFRDEHRSA
jgi:hypothetical protein